VISDNPATLLASIGVMTLIVSPTGGCGKQDSAESCASELDELLAMARGMELESAVWYQVMMGERTKDELVLIEAQRLTGKIVARPAWSAASQVIREGWKKPRMGNGS
jgi:hypothetical protein